jgi:hypothetical protein
MKAAFAKLLQTDPVQSSHTDFRAGGNGVPILTRASGQSTAGFQNMGLPGGNKPFPGGGNNKTVLGSIRMGDDDGNGPASAIVGGVGEIFFPFRAPDRTYPERTFPNVGNNVFQPENNDVATIALLRRLGDQKFKAESQAPFEDYRAQQRLASDLVEASRNASLSDVNLSREIIRNLAQERRQQNEDDYLRKMLDAGATPEAAKKEIEDVRNANAIQEAKKVDDRQYQAKMLISRIAMGRGVTPMVREPLNQSSSIDNPQRSQAMSAAMGMPGEGFGTSPLDMNRQFLTPDFYKKYLRKTNLSQESVDEQSAFNSLLARGQLGEMPPGAFSFATLKAQERQNQVELAAEGLEARLESLRARGRRIKRPLLNILIAKDVLSRLYQDKSKKVGNEVFYTLETIQEMNPLQLVIALNNAIASDARGYDSFIDKVMQFPIPTSQVLDATQSALLLQNMKELVQSVNKDEPNIQIPFANASSSIPVNMNKLASILNAAKTDGLLKAEQAKAYKEYLQLMQVWEELTRDIVVPPSREPLSASMTTRPIPGAPGSVRPARVAAFAARAARAAAPAPVPTPAPASVRPARVAAFAARAARAAAPPATPSRLTQEGLKSLTKEQIIEELDSRNIDKGKKISTQSLRKLLSDNL